MKQTQVSPLQSKTRKLSIEPELVSVLDVIAEDPNLPLLMDRQFPGTLRSRLGYFLKREYAPKSVLNYWAECFNWVMEYYAEFRIYRPDRLICPSTPHQAKWYVRIKVAEQLGIPIYVIHNSRIPGYYRIHQGLGRTPEAIKISGGAAEEYVKAATDYIARCRGSYSSAIPSYEKRRLERNKGQHFRLTRLAMDYWRRPAFIINAWLCWNALKERSLELDEMGNRPFAIFYLHYQPERTTLPEGYGFTQQIRAIINLRSALPDDVFLLVKEHPSIFTNQCSPKARDPNFYRVIERIPGVHFVDLRTDNFVLVDRSVLTATICGTVNTESLLRGKPTIVFGIAKFGDVFGQHYYRSMPALKEFIREVLIGHFPQSKVSHVVEAAILNEADQVIRFEPEESPGERRRIAETMLKMASRTQSVVDETPVSLG